MGVSAGANAHFTESVYGSYPLAQCSFQNLIAIFGNPDDVVAMVKNGVTSGCIAHIRQVCKELGVQIVSGVLSKEHVHMFVEIPPHIAVSDVVRRVKGRSSHRVQMEFPELRKRYWGRHFWARGYFCTTSGNITDEAILQYLKYHEPTGVSR